MSKLEPVMFVEDYNNVQSGSIGYLCEYVADSGYIVPLVLLHDEKLYEYLQHFPTRFNYDSIKDNHSLTFVKPWERCIIKIDSLQEDIKTIDEQINCLNRKRDMLKMLFKRASMSNLIKFKNYPKSG